VTQAFFPKEPIEPGAVIGGKYVVERVLGFGGFGVVVRARHGELGQRVAVKLLRGDHATEPLLRKRFRNEARAAATIQSEHVVRVFDVSPFDAALPYMVMDYLEGEDLAQLLEQGGPMRVDDAIAYVVEACTGVAIAHAAGVVHRDLKPSNLFRARRDDGTHVVKVLDFGISKQTNDAGQPKTASGTVHGTPAYMAPEQLLAHDPVDGRVDVWALGVILYELLTNRTPWEAETVPSVISMILFEPPTPPSWHRETLPPDVCAIVMRCLAKDRAARFESPVALAEALSRLCPARTEGTVAQMHASLERARNRTSLLPLPALLPMAPTIACLPQSEDVAACHVTIEARRPGRRKLVLAAIGFAIGISGGTLAAAWRGAPPSAHATAAMAARWTPPIDSSSATPIASTAPPPTLVDSAIAPPAVGAPPTPTRAPRMPPRASPSDDDEFGGRK
jgi:serine/threonine-protein kinase